MRPIALGSVRGARTSGSTRATGALAGDPAGWRARQQERSRDEHDAAPLLSSVSCLLSSVSCLLSPIFCILSVLFDPTSTIAAIATPPGRGGIGVVRISGPEARPTAQRILTTVKPSREEHAAPGCGDAANARNEEAHTRRDDEAARVLEPGFLSPAPGSGVPALAHRHATYCLVMGPGRGPIDEAVATFFAGPHSYTGEDVVEISAHGSPELLREILQAALLAGARLAEPGEFTLRAFLNGRMDLAQAEAVNDLVDAVTPLQARVAFDQLQGTLTEAVGALDRELFDLVVRLEASLDFPEEGYHFADRGEIASIVARVREGVAALLATAKQGRVVREGRQIAILGKPNVGKSTLFNRLVGAERAIVTDIPGTTRDLLTETVDFEGIRLGVVDTAGIRAGADVIEAEGVARARRAAAVADVVVLVFDQSRRVEAWDRDLLAEVRGLRRVPVVNKTDLPAVWRWAELAGSMTAGHPKPVRLSLKSGQGWDTFRSALLRALEADEAIRDSPMVTNIRHQNLLEEALGALDRATASPAGVSEEFLLADLAGARRAFEEITGRRTTEDVLRAIFSRFCIGK
ncbi:MAG: tRNA uridine-5-carboxymethylaminomethyl(34) synthesis GTPase MnmE [Acidobacteriota bacterium]